MGLAEGKAKKIFKALCKKQTYKKEKVMFEKIIYIL